MDTQSQTRGQEAAKEAPPDVETAVALEATPKIEFDESHYRAAQERLLELQDEQIEGDRERFNSQLEYLVSVLGYAAGYGSLWRFPYLVYKNGGGTFLVPYFAVLISVGIPLFYFETAIGQIYQKSTNTLYDMFHKKFKGIGVFQVLINVNISLYYNLILAYSIYYLKESFKSPVPWETHDPEAKALHPWNKEYFYQDFLNATEGPEEMGEIVWHIYFSYAIAMLIVFICVQNGVKMSGRVSLVTATLPYVILVIIMLRGLFLPGAWRGLGFLFRPDTSKLLDPQIWMDAMCQVLFQLSVGCSVLVLYGSYRPRNTEILRFSVLIPLVTAACGLICAICIFSYLGFMSQSAGLTFAQLQHEISGPSLAFIIFPAVLTMLPFTRLWSVLFFINMFLLGIDTEFATIDGIVGAIQDEYGVPEVTLSYDIPVEQRHLHKKVRFYGRIFSNRQVRLFVCLMVCASGFLFSTQAGFYYMDIVDSYSCNINLILSVFLEVIFFTWKMSWRETEQHIVEYVREPTHPFIVLMNKYWVPMITGYLTINAVLEQIAAIDNTSPLVIVIGWFFTAYPIVAMAYIYRINRVQPPSDVPLTIELEYVKYQVQISNRGSALEHQNNYG